MTRDIGDIDLCREAREVFDVSLRSVDAHDAVRGEVRLDGPHLTIRDTTINVEKARGIYALAIGKAAFPMAVALEEVLKDRLTQGLAVGQALHRTSFKDVYPSAIQSTRWRMIEGDHPLPTQTSLNAAQSAFELLERANQEKALVLFLVSGGGSSMIEWPNDEKITLADLRIANRALVSCGASISEINAVRRSYSAVKGGALGERAPHADQITLVISDTARGQESIVASGPTLEPPVDSPDALEVSEQYKLAEQLPASILRAVDHPKKTIEKNTQHSLRRHYVLLDCETAIKSATDEARRRGFVTEFTTDISEQPIDEGCKLMLTRLSELHSRTTNPNEIVCLISGGEFSCPVRGDGIGGRNAETALRCAIEIDETKRRDSKHFNMSRLVVLSAGTDGIDGNSRAAGAVASDETCGRARGIGLDPGDFLLRSDAYSFFDALGDTIVTGPTGTNVRDLRITLATLECAD